MGKSRADIQKAYRERKKQALGQDFLKAERERVRQYYVPASLLSKKKRAERNQKNKLRNQLCRACKNVRLNALRVRETSDDEPSDSGYSSIAENPGNSSTPLIVKLPAMGSATRANGAKKARIRALAKAHKSISKLQQKKKELERKLKAKSKQIERINKRLKLTEQRSKQLNLTPNRQTQLEVTNLGLSPTSKKKISKKLLLTNVLLVEVRRTKDKSTCTKQAILHRIVSGKIAQKYRCLTGISKGTGLCRRALMNCKSKSVLLEAKKRKCIFDSIAKDVHEFLTREDNCRVQPGKGDVKKGHQTRVLTDYMRNLHQKFVAENPSLKISLATFCCMRPKHVLLARFIARNACQCLKHQNMALKIHAMRKLCIKISENPENICTHKDNLDSVFDEIDPKPDIVKYRTWKRVDMQNKIKKTMVVEQEASLQEFQTIVKQEVESFCEHVSRLRAQYNQLKTNKSTLA